MVPRHYTDGSRVDLDATPAVADDARSHFTRPKPPRAPRGAARLSLPPSSSGALRSIITDIPLGRFLT